MPADKQLADLHRIFPVCYKLTDERSWLELRGHLAKTAPADIPQLFAEQSATAALPAYLPDLARLEWAYYQAAQVTCDFKRHADRPIINPTLQLLELSWENLTPLVIEKGNDKPPTPRESPQWVVVFRGPQTKKMRCRPATAQELLALKIISEELTPEEIARENQVPVSVIDTALNRADSTGLILAPESKIKRDPTLFTKNPAMDAYQTTPVFTLQWHITQACDLHCLHCYDRSSRKQLDLAQGFSILDDLQEFCRRRNVAGHISLTGGNPLLHPHFNDLYQQAATLGFSLAILGNPAPREQIEEIIAIKEPEFFQVSLEGLQEHNDAIRGPGHYERVMKFLGILKSLGLYSMVMLTLTKDNMAQVLPLAEILRDKTDLFTFNRLSPTGEGARLEPAARDSYAEFLKEFIKAAENNPTISLKDNLINIIQYQEGKKPFGGCAGFGCGAAFNFVTLLPDGEVHACRKFTSPIGNINENDLATIYDAPLTEQYRNGPRACRDCAIRPVCGGCLAVSQGLGMNIFEDRDPYCFMPTTS